MSGRGIPKDVADRIKERSKLEDIIPGLNRSGKDLITKCPFCGREGKGKGLTVSPSKQVWKCFADSCGRSGQGAVSYVMAIENLKYPEALRWLAEHYHMIIDEPVPVPSTGKKKSPAASREKTRGKKPRGKTFCDLQLESSGLTPEDVKVEVKNNDDKTTRDLPAFRTGSRSQYGDITPGEGDDMLIYYYDLEGRPVMYKREGSKVQHPLIRVRWQNPMQHLDKGGDPIKYQSPYGSGSHIYIPERIRKLYRNTRKIETLFIQEGEKKAEKCCKHGIPSVGIMGINNLGYQSRFPVELQLIIQRCEVDRVVFVLDSDWSDLSDKLKPGARVDNRPKSFFSAVRNYKEYMLTLKPLGLSLEILFGYIRKNDKQEKGIDDLMAGTLKGNEQTMGKDLEKAIFDKEGDGEYVKVHKITQKDDKDIADLWLLNDKAKFTERHHEILTQLGEFTFKKMKWRFNEGGEVEMAQPLRPEEMYWQEEKIDTRSGPKTVLHFNYVRCFRFLQARGYYRILMKSGEFRFIKVDGPVIEIVDNYHIKDFVTAFTEALDDKEDVLNMIYRGGPQYLGFEKLSNLQYFNPGFERATRTNQCLFFKEKIWEISHEGIKELQYNEMKNKVWKDKIIDFDAERTKEDLFSVIRITKENKKQFPGYEPGDFYMELTETGSKCDYLKFLLNTSNFFWKKLKKGGDLTTEDEIMTTRHLLNKLTCLGFLMHDYKNDSENKAIIAMDGMLSEVGASEGRSGKSIVGVGLEYVLPQVYIAAKSRKLTEDNFLFGEVNEKTKIVFLDDVRANIDFEFFFPLITGKLKVNPKGGQPFTLDKEDTPKLLISTNHAINGDGSSFTDRQAYMAFSDYYNDTHKPVHDFHQNFFTEWGKEQWNLFYNLKAACLNIYFRSLKEGWVGNGQGIIDPPMGSIEKRRLRQKMGEDFLAWADEYFSSEINDDENLGTVKRMNRRQVRKELYDDLMDKNPHVRKWISPSSFSKRIKAFCLYNKYHYNPTVPNREGVEFADYLHENPRGIFMGEADKSGGTEYMTIADSEYMGMI